MRPTRLTDLVCDRHLAICDTRWRVPAGSPCGECHDRVQCELAKMGGDPLLHLPTLTRGGGPSEYERVEAIHEIGHALVGMFVGRPLKEIVLGRSGRRPPHEHAAAWVDWKRPIEPRMDLEEALAISWAGQEATLLHLRDIGLTGRADQMDAFFLARHDMRIIDTLTAGRDLPRDLGRGLANRILDGYVDVVKELADDLQRHAWLDGDDVTARYGPMLGIRPS